MRTNATRLREKLYQMLDHAVAAPIVTLAGKSYTEGEVTPWSIW